MLTALACVSLFCSAIASAESPKEVRLTTSDQLTVYGDLHERTPEPSTPAAAQTRVEPIGEARIRIQRGGQKLDLDLAGEISGCTGPLFDRSVNETHEGGASFEVLDETRAGADTYLVLFASAQANCNIQGQCGAAVDSTLVWLKLDENLKVAGKQAVVLEDCRAVRYVKVDYADGEQLQGKDLPWKDRILQVDYEEESESQAIVRRLIYDRNHPDAGFRIEPRNAGDLKP